MRADIAIYNILKNSVAITNIVAGNIYPIVVPQGVTASDVLTYQTYSLTSYDTKDKYNDYHAASVQISCFSANANTAANLQELVRTTLERFSGTVGTTTTVTVDNIFFENAEDLSYLDTLNKYHRVVNFKIFFY
jgi:hypothetical protein